MKSSSPLSAQCRSSKTITTGELAASRSKNVRQAAKSWADGIPDSKPSSARRADSIHCGLGRIR